MHVIFVAPHFPSNQRNFPRALKAVGAHVSAIGDAPWEALDRELKSWIDDYWYVPQMLDEGALESAVRGIQKKGPWVDRLESTIETHMQPVANVRERCGIPGLSPRQVLVCRDKALMKEVLRQAGIPCAKSARIESVEDALRFAEAVGYPLILKPLAGAGAAGTSRVDDEQELRKAAAEFHFGRGGSAAIEEFIEGHEGFFDTLLLGDRIAYEGISHYFPGVLHAMRTRSVSPAIVTTNQVETNAPYQEVRQLGRDVIKAFGLHDTATHQEWFFGPKGLKFSEIGARPPGVCFWDVHNAANDMDLYVAWAEALTHGRVSQRPSRRFSAALLALRPNQDGRISGYSGLDEVQRRYGDNLVKMHLPPQGARTQGVEGGYMANAWMIVRHPSFDHLKGIIEDIGNTLKVWAS